MNLCNLGEVRALLEKHGIAPRKSFGQNFLVNSAIPEEIADTSAYAPFLFPENESDNARVLEIGPGIGALTRELAARYPAVTAVEIDDGLIPVLAETLSDLENVRVIHSDFLKTDARELIEELSGGVPVHVCANLPYYVTTPILQKLLDTFPPDGTSPLRRITLLVQSELRIASVPRQKTRITAPPPFSQRFTAGQDGCSRYLRAISIPCRRCPLPFSPLNCTRTDFGISGRTHPAVRISHRISKSSRK